MFTSLLNVMFGCSHKRTTFPITRRSQISTGGTRKGTYVVCLECGQEFAYNWKDMRIDSAAVPIANRPQVDNLPHVI
jgi:hypothetical protein